jgi:hypothetical protein
MSTLAAINYAPFNQVAQSLSIHGAAVELNLDGMSDLSMTGVQGYNYTPSTDSVQEFKITTNAFDAAAGRSPGGAIDVTLKTGTRRLHGAVYEELRRGFLDANSTINNAHKDPSGNLANVYQRPAHTQDQFGIEFDGPVILPKLIRGNKQMFFLAQYENYVESRGASSVQSLPTQAMIGKGAQYPGTGDFSELLNVVNGGKTYSQAIYDPLTEASCTARNTDNGSYGAKNPHVCRYQFGYGPGSAPGPQGGPTLTGAPINVIPASRMDPVAMAIASWYPLPNQAPTFNTTNFLSNNFAANAPVTNNYRNYLLKLDQNYGDRDTYTLELRLWTVFGTSNGNGYPINDVNASHPGTNWAAYGAHFTNHFKDPSVVVGWTHTFSARLVNSLKGQVAITDQTDNTGPQPGFNPTSLGLPASLAATNPQYFNRFPSVTPGNYGLLGSISGLKRGDNELLFLDTVNFTRGNHSMHFGVDLRPAQYSQRISNGAGNAINVSVGKGWTQEWDTVVTGSATNISNGNNFSGNSIASMLLGTIDSGNAQYQPNNFYSFAYNAAFFEDDWKVRPNLTLNLGMRWEKPYNGNRDRHNRQVAQFDATDVNPINGMITPGSLPVPTTLLGGITFAGVNGRPRTPFVPVWDDFGPRVGFAYVVNQKTVLRGGIGVYYADNPNQFAPPQTGYSSNTVYTGTLDGGATPLQNLDNPFPVLQTPTGNCGGALSPCLQTNAGQSLTFFNPTYRPPTYVESSLNIERQLTKHDTIEIAYAGSRGYNGTYTDDINHISSAAQAACDPERGGVGTNCTAGASTGTGGYVNNPFKGLAPFAASGTYYSASTIQRINFTRPYPIFTGVSESNLNGTHQWYNAGEVTYNHRVSAGATLHVTYTYSKSMTQGGYTDLVNRVVTRQISGSDNPHRVTVSGIYQMPIGRGRSYFSGMNRFLDFAIGGWQVGEVFTYQSGLPFGIGGYEINPTANGGYILPRKRFWGGNTNSYWPGDKGASANSYVQAFKPCVGTRDPNTGVVALQSYSVTAGCGQANFIQVGSFGVTPAVEYTGIRLQRIVNMDANISKKFNVIERIGMVFELRLEAFNALNHPIWNSSGYSTSAGDSNFGTIQLGNSGGQNNVARQVQLNGRLSW